MNCTHANNRAVSAQVCLMKRLGLQQRAAYSRSEQSTHMNESTVFVRLASSIRRRFAANAIGARVSDSLRLTSAHRRGSQIPAFIGSNVDFQSKSNERLSRIWAATLLIASLLELRDLFYSLTQAPGCANFRADFGRVTP
jgi:hypothetical protein